MPDDTKREQARRLMRALEDLDTTVEMSPSVQIPIQLLSEDATTARPVLYHPELLLILCLHLLILARRK